LDSPQDIEELYPIRQPKETANDRVDWVKESGNKPLHNILETFVQDLVHPFNEFFNNKMKIYADYPPVVYFSIKHAHNIAKNLDKLTLDNINKLI
jgi:hypothetical protein